MTTFEKFILAFETGIRYKKTEDEQIETSYARAQQTGWSDDPKDAGGATMCGVTLSTYRTWCKGRGYPSPTKDDLRKIPYAHWHLILKKNFWDLAKADLIVTKAIAYIIVDWIWGSGPKVIRRVQKILGVKQDGIIGPKTLKAINTAPQQSLFGQIKADRFRYLDEICKARPANIRFLRGWENRLNAIQYTALQIYS